MMPLKRLIQATKTKGDSSLSGDREQSGVDKVNDALGMEYFSL
jgi:hypothetical protein